jgi:hypothetical protein
MTKYNVGKGGFFMRKIIFCFLCVLVFLNANVVNAASVPGHPDFQEITIPGITTSKLIHDMDKSTINSAYKRLKHKIFGWSIEGIVVNQLVYYKGETVFAKNNNTSQTLKFTYLYKEEEDVTTSISASSSLCGKISGKIKAVNASLDETIRGEIGWKKAISTTESTEIYITIAPRTRLTVSIRGEATLNNGVCKYYFLGIPFKKGEWEYIDVVNEYYDYYEETTY